MATYKLKSSIDFPTRRPRKGPKVNKRGRIKTAIKRKLARKGKK